MQLGYGKEKIEFSVDAARLKGVLLPNSVEAELRGADEVRRALDNPIGADRIENTVKPGQKVCIITSDISRPMPSKTVLPPLVERLNLAGIPDGDIFIVFALGSHRHHTDDEKKYLVGEDLFSRIECIDSDPSRCVHLGVTEKGTDVDIFDRVVNADFRICCGNIEYHYFAGYSGGAKAIMPGVSTPAAIKQNHRMMVDERSCAGNIDSPVRLDIEEAGRIMGIDYILNVVLDEHKQVIRAVCGDSVAAHREGCAFLDRLYSVNIKEKADIVVVTADGYPKDLNMYQAQKALDNSKHAVKKGGIIIWLAECTEGLGNARFEEWMTTKSPAQMISDIRSDFMLGGHKAAAISMVLQNARIFLVSSLAPDFVRKINLEPYPSLDAAFAAATEALGADSSVYVMPYGGSTLPKLR